MKHPLLPIEYEERPSEVAYNEMIFERVTFIEDFGHVKKDSYYESIYISLDLGYIVLSNEGKDETIYVEFKIKEISK